MFQLLRKEKDFFSKFRCTLLYPGSPKIKYISFKWLIFANSSKTFHDFDEFRNIKFIPLLSLVLHRFHQMDLIGFYVKKSFLFVNVTSRKSFSSCFWYQSIAIDEAYPTLSCASRKMACMASRIVFRIPIFNKPKGRNTLLHSFSSHSSLWVSCQKRFFFRFWTWPLRYSSLSFFSYIPF